MSPGHRDPRQLAFGRRAFRRRALFEVSDDPQVNDPDNSHGRVALS